MLISWNHDKNELLKKTRNLSFELVITEIKAGRFIGPEENPRYKHQQRIIVLINTYPHIVPLVIDENGNWFLKTIFPSRKVKRGLSK